MRTRDAVALITGAIPRRPAVWADFGAGAGTFTRALLELLEPPSRIYAVDRDAGRVAALARLAGRRPGIEVIAVAADFTRPFELPGRGRARLDGMLFANALHFVPPADAGAVLARLVRRLRPGGRVVLLEYDGRPASPWVPHPVPVARLPTLAAAARLGAFTITATQPSAYGGILYVAVADWGSPAPSPHG